MQLNEKWMILWIPRALLLSAGFLTASHATYHLQLRIERNDVVVANSDVDVDAGVAADIRIGDDNEDAMAGDTDADIRIVVQVKPARGTNSDVAIDLQYFEKRATGWLMVGEPSIVAAAGETSTVAFSDDSSSGGSRPDRYKFSITASENGPDHRKTTASRPPSAKTPE